MSLCLRHGSVEAQERVARTAVRRRPRAPSRLLTSSTAGLPGMTAWMAFWAGLDVTDEGLSDGPPVPAGGAMSWHAVMRGSEACLCARSPQPELKHAAVDGELIGGNRYSAKWAT